MMPALIRVGSIVVPVALALSGYFYTTVAALGGRVDTLQTQNASITQQTKDIDSRLTRIEDKLDNVLQTAQSSQASKR